MTPSRELEIENSANLVRCRLYVYDTLPVNMSTALTRIGDIGCVPRASYTTLPKDRMKYDKAYTDCQTKTVFLPDNFPSELGPKFKQNRFTLAHEIGHLALGHSGVRSRAAVNHEFRKQSGVPGAPREESEASYWAAAFLMPAAIVMECETPEILAARCNVSLEAARIRKENIDRRQRRDRREERPIPEDTNMILAEIFRNAGVIPKTFKINKPESLKKTEATGTAEIRGYQTVPCSHCGSYELLQEGGCFTCQNCGDSNCN